VARLVHGKRPRDHGQQVRRNLSSYRGMWLFVMFDLPVDDTAARRQYAQFRTRLLADGFSMLQYSIYARYFPSEEASAAHRRRVRATLPREGEVRLLSVTDKQFGKMEIFLARSRAPTEKPPEQLLLL
jgi:CRISPR-associated protein Cas2